MECHDIACYGMMFTHLPQRCRFCVIISYYVIPSFFHCLLTLKEAGADFGVVFRTFGSDIEGVSREYNAFCEGKHPLFPGVKMDGR